MHFSCFLSANSCEATSKAATRPPLTSCLPPSSWCNLFRFRPDFFPFSAANAMLIDDIRATSVGTGGSDLPPHLSSFSSAFLRLLFHFRRASHSPPSVFFLAVTPPRLFRYWSWFIYRYSRRGEWHRGSIWEALWPMPRHPVGREWRHAEKRPGECMKREASVDRSTPRRPPHERKKTAQLLFFMSSRARNPRINPWKKTGIKDPNQVGNVNRVAVIISMILFYMITSLIVFYNQIKREIFPVFLSQ